jgi:hypothetical protein
VPPRMQAQRASQAGAEADTSRERRGARPYSNRIVSHSA